MGRLLAAACAIGTIFLLFLTVATAREHPDENPLAPLSPTTGGVVTTTPFVAALLADGMRSSPTFAAIASQLLAGDVLCVVEPDLRIKRGLYSYMMLITRTPTRRYLRIYFDPRLPNHMAIAMIGHELHHALEVANHPEVVDQATLLTLYRMIGRANGSRCCSEAAGEAGRLVLRELNTPARANGTASAGTSK